MSDNATETVEPGTTEEQAAEVEAMTPAEAKPEKAPKVDPTKPCFCSFFEVTDTKDESGDSTFTTGCEQTTKRQFAQGHDARLVSFLVDYWLDDYSIRMIKDGVAQSFATPADAAALASDKLRDKAAAATENGVAKIKAKKAKADEREAAKAEKAKVKEAAAQAKKEKADAAASAPKDVPVTVVEGSQEGDGPAGVVRIKVGRKEYDATVDGEGTARFLDEKTGEEQVIERDGYRLLTRA